MNKKIIFFVPNIDDGGIEKNLVILSNYFLKKNHDVEIIFSRISRKILKKLNSKIILKKTNNYLNLKFLNERVNNSINCFIFCLLKLKVKKKSVLFSMQDHPFGILLSMIKNIPSIIRIANHPIGSLKYFNNYFIYKIKLFIKLFFYHFANIIICNSKESALYVRNSLIYKKKIFSIYNPISRKKYKEKFKRIKYELVTIGRLEKQKNLEGLIDAIRLTSKKIPMIKLTIVGKGSQKKKLQKLVKKFQLTKHVKFKNFSNPYLYYKNQGVFILNSFFEGLPNVLLEAMQYKIPIIASKCQSGPTEILLNGKYGSLVKVNDPKDLSNKIEKVILNYPDAIKKAKIALESLNRFDEEKQSYKYLKIIKSLN